MSRIEVNANTDDEKGEDTSQVEESSTDESQEEAQGEGERSESDESAEDESSEERIARLEKSLAEARREAADRRVKNRELSESLASAKTEDDIRQAVAEHEDKVAALERELLMRDVAAEHGIPEALRARLVGETREEIEADAKALAEMFGAQMRSTNPRGGLDPQAEADSDIDMNEIIRRAHRGY